MKNLDFLIIGAQKSGTTSLRKFLEAIPERIFMLRSEQHFWNRDGHYRDGYGIETYLNLFNDSRPSQLRGEKSPSYFPSFEAPARIARHFPDVKLIAILRNPIERAYSAYWHGRRVGAIATGYSFTESLRDYQKNHGKPYGDLISPGLYSQHLERYYEFFPKSQLLVLDFQKVVENPESELPLALDFLGIDVAEISSDIDLHFPKSNVARFSRFPRLSTWLHQTHLLSYEKKAKILRNLLKKGDIPEMAKADCLYLEEIYSEEASKIEILTGRRFDWGF